MVRDRRLSKWGAEAPRNYSPSLEGVAWPDLTYGNWSWGNVSRHKGDTVVLGPESLYTHGRDFRYIPGSESHRAVVQTFRGKLLGIMEGHCIDQSGTMSELPLVECESGEVAADVPSATIGEPFELDGHGLEGDDPVVAVWFDARQVGASPYVIERAELVLPAEPPFHTYWQQIIEHRVGAGTY